jgi:hypothetical protein
MDFARQGSDGDATAFFPPEIKALYDPVCHQSSAVEKIKARVM